MKLTKIFKERLDFLIERAKSLENSDETREEFNSLITQINVIKSIENDIPLILKEINPNPNPNPNEEGNRDSEIEIEKFNTPDKVTDIEGNSYRRVKFDNSLIFKKIKENKYFIITSKPVN